MTIFTSARAWFKKPAPRFAVPEIPGFTLPLPTLGLWYSGIWPMGLTWQFKTYTVFTMCIVFKILTGEFLYCVKFWENIDICAAVGTLLGGIRALSICVHLLWKRKQFAGLMKKFAAEIWISRDNSEKDYLTTEKETVLINYFSASFIGAMLLFSIMPYVNSRNLPWEDKEFPFRISFPYPLTNPIVHNLEYVQCVHMGWACVTVIVAQDALLNYILIYTCTRIKRLHLQIVNIGDKITGIEEDNDVVEKALADTVDEHNRIIEFVNEVEDLFSPVILFQFMLTSFLMCVLGIEILYVPEGPLDVLKVTLYFLNSLGQLYGICYSGQQLIECSSEIGDAAYNFKWIDVNKKFHMNIIMIIQRSQNPLRLTAYKFFNLSMESFSAICRTAGSYFALVKQLMQKKYI